MTYDRPPVALVAASAIGAAEQRVRALAARRFRAWCLAQQRWISEEAFQGFLHSASPPEIARLLARYGQHLYDSGAPISHLREAVLSVTDERRELRGNLQQAWDSVRVWEQLVPLRNRAPWPLPLWRACVTLALLWGWWDVGLCLVVGFSALLRPAELLSLTVADVLPPSVLGHPIVLIRLNAPKNRRRCARREHVRIADPPIVRFIEGCLARYPRADSPLFAGSRAEFLRLTGILVHFFGIPFSENAGVTLAGLRAGGATFQYLAGISLEQIRWNGRWQAPRTLEFYIQECAALSLLAALPPRARMRVHQFSALTLGLLRRSTAIVL